MMHFLLKLAISNIAFYFRSVLRKWENLPVSIRGRGDSIQASPKDLLYAGGLDQGQS